jgi:alanine-glyoxylate transaminase/(R)-3-amino-2-methylpropionate-pyruvate transaminase
LVDRLILLFICFVLNCCTQLNIVEGKMQYLYDENGRRYLDAFAGIVTVSCGHCHPEVLEAIVEQSKLLQHATTIYLHHAIADYAEALASKMPGNLTVVLLLEICFLVIQNYE